MDSISVRLLDVDIPDEFLMLACDWYSGMGDMLYALASTGDLSPGTQRPWHPDDDRPMTDHEWHVHLWSCLSVDVMHARMAAEKIGHEDAEALARFEDLADEACERLAAAYGLEG